MATAKKAKSKAAKTKAGARKTRKTGKTGKAVKAKTRARAKAMVTAGGDASGYVGKNNRIQGSRVQESRAVEKFQAAQDAYVRGHAAASANHYPIPDSLFGITPRAEELIADGIRDGRARQVRTLFQMLHPAEQADLAERLGRVERRRLYRILGPTLNTDMLKYLHAEARDDAFSLIGAAQMAESMRPEFQTDDALGLLEQLEPDTAIPEEEAEPSHAESIKASKQKDYKPNTIGAVMFRNALVLPAEWTAAHALDFLRSDEANLPPEFYSVFVQGEDNKKIGQVMLSSIVSAGRSTRMDQIMKDLPYRIPATTPKDEVALLFKRFHLVSAPIVDEQGRIVSVVTFDDVVDVIEEEAAAELLKLNKVSTKKGDSFLVALRGRTTWLFVNFGTAMLAASVIGLFDATIEKIVALAVLFPMVASMGGNAGTQTITVAVRGLATREVTVANMWKFVGREGGMSLVNGTLFALIGGGISLLWFQDIPLSMVMMVAMMINMLAAGVFGALIPLTLQRMGADPAISSSVFITTITDVTGFFSFLGIATLFLL